MAKEKVILIHEAIVEGCMDLEDGKIWSLYEDTENMDLICWTRTKKEATQYAKENNLVITNK